MVPGVDEAQLAKFALGVSPVVVVRWWLGLESSWTRSYVLAFDAGYQLVPQPGLLACSTHRGPLGHPQSLAAGFQESSKREALNHISGATLRSHTASLLPYSIGWEALSSRRGKRDSTSLYESCPGFIMRKTVLQPRLEKMVCRIAFSHIFFFLF